SGGQKPGEPTRLRYLNFRHTVEMIGQATTDPRMDPRIFSGAKAMKTFLIAVTLFNCSLLAAPGYLRWSFNAGGPIRSSPALGTNGWIIFGTLSGDLYALDPADGKIQWKTPAGGRVASSPCIGADGTVYIGSTNGLLALNGTT